MKKKLLIILWPYRFRKFDYTRYELNKLEREKNFQILVHELIDIFYPHFKKAYKSNFKYKNKKTYKSLKKWKYDFDKILKDKNTKKMIIKHGIKGNNLNEFLINYYLKKAKIDLIEVFGKGFPGRFLYNKQQSKISIMASLVLKTLIKLKNPFEFIFFTKKIIFLFLTKIFCKRKKYAMAGGLRQIKNLKKIKLNKIIMANSFDYTTFLSSKQKKMKKLNKYILFLEAPTPIFPGDELVYKGESYEGTTKKNWVPSLNNFFNEIEKIFKCKVKIAAHPKVKHKKNPKYYDGREILNKPLFKTAYNAKFLISVWSTGHSYAVMYNKPSLFIKSKEMTNQSFLTSQKTFSQSIGSEIINIDEKIEKKKIIKALKIDKKKLEKYRMNFLTSRKDLKPNYKIIGELIK